MTVLEVAAEPNPHDSSPISLLEKGSLARVAKTWDISTTCQYETMKLEQEASFEVLDFSHDLPADKAESYDLLIVSNLDKHVSKSLAELERMSKVVKQGGSMCLLATDTVLARVQSYLYASQIEATVLRSAEGSTAAPSHHPNLIIATKAVIAQTNGKIEADGAGAAAPPQVILVQAVNPTELAEEVASQLSTLLKSHGYETEIFSWGSEVSALADKSCISLLEIQQSLLLDLGADDFEAVKMLLLKTAKLTWVTALANPSVAIIDGIARVVRNETPGLSLRVFHADEASLVSAELLTNLIGKCFLSNGPDNELKAIGGILNVSRLEEDLELDKEVHGLLPGASSTVSSVPLKDVPYPVKLCVQSPGMLSSVCLELDNSTEKELEPDYVEIDVKATALK